MQFSVLVKRKFRPLAALPLQALKIHFSAFPKTEVVSFTYDPR